MLLAVAVERALVDTVVEAAEVEQPVVVLLNSASTKALTTHPMYQVEAELVQAMGLVEWPVVVQGVAVSTIAFLRVLGQVGAAHRLLLRRLTIILQVVVEEDMEEATMHSLASQVVVVEEI